MEIIGYVLAVFIGISLGLIGSGGSILSVPVLVYFFALDAITATSYSLFIVGSASLIGLTQYIKKKELDLKIAITFSIPSIIAVYSIRRFLMPVLPQDLFTVSNIIVHRDNFIMLVFGLLMLLVAIKMILPNKKITTDTEAPKNYLLIALEGLLIGSITGFVGAGGGFLIVPALVIWMKLPMKKAISTSLFIVAAKSLLGFIGDVQSHIIDWTLLISITVVGIIGIFIGLWLNTIVDGKQLKVGFGWFVLVMAVFILVKEISKL